MVRSGEEGEVHEQRALVVGGDERRPAIVERHVGVEELVIEGIEDGDAVCRQGEGIDRVHGDGEARVHDLADVAAGPGDRRVDDRSSAADTWRCGGSRARERIDIDTIGEASDDRGSGRGTDDD